MKNYLKLTLTSIALLSLLVISSEVSASTVTGTLKTGISGNNGNVVDGIVISAPIASPSAGLYTSAQNVTLTASGASSIHYTIDDTNPTCSTGIVYSTPILISVTLSLKAISCYPENNHSTVALYLYGITFPSSAAPATLGGVGGSSAPAITIKADANNDGKTDILDFVALMANWNKSGTNIADFDKDNIVGILDFVALMANWTK